MNHKLILPLPIDRANSRMHWGEVSRRRKAYYQHVTAKTSWAGAAKLAAGEQTRRRVDAFFYTWNRCPDKDNLIARLKWPLDALVNNGFLVDDSEEWMELGMVMNHIDRKQRRLEVMLTDLPEKGAWDAV